MQQLYDCHNDVMSKSTSFQQHAEELNLEVQTSISEVSEGCCFCFHFFKLCRSALLLF